MKKIKTKVPSVFCINSLFPLEGSNSQLENKLVIHELFCKQLMNFNWIFFLLRDKKKLEKWKML